MASTDKDVNIHISVIVTAFNRKEYLEEAIKSVLRQNLDSKYYEIIVVKNFYSETIDDLIKLNNIKSVYSESLNYGKHVLEALKAASGNIIAFLEDDDIYNENHLSYIYNMFTRHKNLGFLKTGFKFLNEVGLPFKVPWKKIKNDIFIDGSKEFNLTAVLNINRYGINAVISAVAIRKLILNEFFPVLERFFIFDFALPYLTLSRGYSILGSGELLCSYRISNSLTNMNILEEDRFLNKKSTLLKKIIRDFIVLLGIFSNLDSNTIHIKRALNYQLTEMQIELTICEGGINKIENLKNYIICSISDKNVKRIMLLLLYYSGKISKQLQRYTYLNYFALGKRT